MSNFEVVIGIEIHIELNTNSKMFSASLNNFDAEPNTNISPIDVAYPGSMPVVNKGAVERAIKLAKALDMEIDNVLHFDRKHYFYPDLPKGFQITQQFRPIGKNGKLPIKKGEHVEIERIHLEEDSAKSHHTSEKTLLDFNRAGIPLIEIVSHPVIRDAATAVAYVDGVRKLVKRLNISDAKMEEGSLRADINISLRPYGQKEFGTKVEIKNINSLSNIDRAIFREIEKQSASLLAGKPIIQATKRFDEASNDTVIMREKTGAADYRYFPEPNIPPIKLSNHFIESISLPDLPWETEIKLKSLGISEEYIKQLSDDPLKLKFVESSQMQDKAKFVKLFFAEIIPILNKQNTTIDQLKIKAHNLDEILSKQEEGIISNVHIKKIIPILLNTDQSVQEIIGKNDLKQISDENILKEMIAEIIDENKDFIINNKDREERVHKFILGQLMKASKGQANPKISAKLVRILIGA